MASLHSVEAAILAQVQQAVTGLTYQGLPIQIKSAIGWPPEKLLQNSVRGYNSVISVYDRKMAKNSTRWKPIVLSTNTTLATITSTLSNSTLAPGATATLTLGSAVTAGDAVSLILNNSSLGLVPNSEGTTFQNVYAQVAIGGVSDTPSTMANQLAALITADPVMSTWVRAIASNGVITLTSLLTTGKLVLQSNVGNGAVNTREIGRRERSFQIVIWSPASDIRDILTGAIETMLQQLELNINLTFSDGSSGRLFNQNDFDLEDASLADTYRHDFIFSVDYPITELDSLFAVLAPIPAYQVQ